MNSKGAEIYSLGMDSSKPFGIKENESKNELVQFQNPETLYYVMNCSKLKKTCSENLKSINMDSSNLKELGKP